MPVIKARAADYDVYNAASYLAQQFSYVYAAFGSLYTVACTISSATFRNSFDVTTGFCNYLPYVQVSGQTKGAMALFLWGFLNDYSDPDSNGMCNYYNVLSTAT